MPREKTIDRIDAGHFKVSIDYGSQMPVYKQISDGIRRSILEGRIAAGDRVPSTRELAQILGVNRLTVLKSFGDLVSKGFVETIIGAGTFVIHRSGAATAMSFQPPDPNQKYKAVELSSFAHSLMAQPVEAGAPYAVSELNYAAPPFEELPVDRWQHLLSRATRVLRTTPSSVAVSPGGCSRLRETLADYLRRARGVECSADQIFFLSHPEAANHLICRLLLNAGDAVAVEDPGCMGRRNALAFHGARAVPFAVDAQGLIVQNLLDSQEAIKLAFVTPSHHDPTGAELTLPRRFDLLRWAQQRGALIVEDDYDAEYRYGDQTPPMVQADVHGSVIYRYNFGRMLHPLVRAGFLVLPLNLVPLFQRAMLMMDFEASPFEQRALADFIAEGHYERYLKRLRTIYAARRASFIQALTVNFGKAISISSVKFGRQILVNLHSDQSDQYLLACARKASFPLTSTACHYSSAAVPGQFQVDCSALSEDEIRPAADIFAALTRSSEDRVESLPDSWFQSTATALVEIR